MRDKSAACEHDDTDQKGDEKANTETHYLQFSAIARAVPQTIRLHNRFPAAISIAPLETYDTWKLHQGRRARLVHLATKVDTPFPDFHLYLYNVAGVISV